MRMPHDSLGVALIVTVGPSILPGTPSAVRSLYWRAPETCASALSIKNAKTHLGSLRRLFIRRRSDQPSDQGPRALSPPCLEGKIRVKNRIRTKNRPARGR